MHYLVIAPQLGFLPSGEMVSGGLLNFCRCIIRALASAPAITRLGIWVQVDPVGVERAIKQMVQIYAHPSLELDIRVFGGSRMRLAAALARSNMQRDYDRVMYPLVNQSVLSQMPGHPPYVVWEVGREFFQPISRWKYDALCRAETILSISHHTNRAAIICNPGLPAARVVHLCVEPPLFAAESPADPLVQERYIAANRVPAVLIVANLHQELMYKGHQQLIAAWPAVTSMYPTAELWIVGDGSGRPHLESQIQALLPHVARQIRLFGRLDDDELQQCYRRCRVFAMPSTGEGFGLVFVEAARYAIPCIGSKYDSVKEVVLHNETGLLVEQHPHHLALACQRLLMDDAFAQRLGEAGRQRYLHNFRFQHFRDRLLHALGLTSAGHCPPDG